MVFSIAAAFPTLLFVGAAIDYAQLARSRINFQQVIDAAVLAGVRAPPSQRGTVATNMLVSAVATAAFANVAARWITNPDGSFSGLATASQRLLFASVFGVGGATVGAAATAIAATTSSATKVCALVLDPASTRFLC